jgi:uncharacterized RDD family membrane protein YckC
MSPLRQSIIQFMSSQPQQLDTAIRIVTPENIAFEYRLAGPFRRLAAYLLDLIIRIAALAIAAIAILIAFGTLGFIQLGVGVIFFLLFLTEWFYGGLFETFWNGQTPGKHLLKIRVISITGQPISGWQAVLRNLLRVADAMPVLVKIPTFQVGLIAMALNDRFQRLGDLVSGTMVVLEEQQKLYGVARVDEPEAIRLAGYLPANFQVSRSLARTLSGYVQRRKGFLPARRAEIARHLGEPLRQKFNLPPGTSYDLLLCALYHLAFIARAGAEVGDSPFAEAIRPATAAEPVEVAQ